VGDASTIQAMILSRRFEPSRIIRLVMVLQALGLLAGVLWTGYAGATYSEVISFRVDDGWCQTPNEGIGEHCLETTHHHFATCQAAEFTMIFSLYPPQPSRLTRYLACSGISQTMGSG